MFYKKGLFVALLLALVACSSGVNDVPEVEEETLENLGLSKRVSLRAHHDAEENRSGRTYLYGRDLELGYDSGRRTVGVQFAGLSVPRGATITDAYIQFRADETDESRVRLAIRAEAADSASTHTRRRHDLSSRKTTAAVVTWTPKEWERGERSVRQRTPSLAPLVQEVVNRRGWRSGHNLGFVITGRGGGKRVASALNSGSRKGARLVVEYEDASAGQPESNDERSVPIILDTDFGFDVDDVGALAVLHALADNGEAKILATVSVVTDPHTPGAIDAVNTYYGHPNLPVGQNDHAPRRYRWDRAYPYWRNAPWFVRSIDREFPNNMSARRVPSAVATYRKVLAAQPDGSVTVVVVGFMKNMPDLLRSGPDRYSSLSGRELVRRKVKKLVVMGGSFESEDRDFNLTGGPARSAKDAKYVIHNWPTELVFTGGELCGLVYTGRTLKNPRKNPVTRAYRLFGSRHGRSSWDLCSVLYAVRGESHQGRRYFSADSSRRLMFNGLVHYWASGGRKNQKRLKLETSVTALERVLEKLITQPPR